MEQYSGQIERVSVTATSAGTTTLVNTSQQIQVFTGSTTQTVILPVATTYTKPGAKFEFYNASTGSIQINYQDSTAFETVLSGGSLIAKLSDNTISNGIWVTLSGVNSTPAPTPTSSARVINAQVGTTYTFVLTDGSQNGNNPLVTFGNAGSTTVTVPLNSSVAFPVGAQIDCIQQGAGSVTFSPAGGVTLNSNGGLVIGAQYVGVSLIQTATNVWTIIGNLV